MANIDGLYRFVIPRSELTETTTCGEFAEKIATKFSLLTGVLFVAKEVVNSSGTPRTAVMFPNTDGNVDQNYGFCMYFSADSSSTSCGYNDVLLSKLYIYFGKMKNDGSYVNGYGQYEAIARTDGSGSASSRSEEYISLSDNYYGFGFTLDTRFLSTHGFYSFFWTKETSDGIVSYQVPNNYVVKMKDALSDSTRDVVIGLTNEGQSGTVRNQNLVHVWDGESSSDKILGRPNSFVDSFRFIPFYYGRWYTDKLWFVCTSDSNTIYRYTSYNTMPFFFDWYRDGVYVEGKNHYISLGGGGSYNFVNVAFEKLT